MKIIASDLITLWQIEGGRVEAVTDFIFLGSKITADGNYSHEIKRCLLLWRKAMRNLDRIFKSRDTTLVCIVKVTVFPEVVYGCESWTIKKADHWRIDALKLWCWRRLFSLLFCKEIKPVNIKRNQHWIFNGRRIFIGRTDAKIDTPIL